MPGGRSPTKKALLVGISYHSETESCCQDPLGPIPTSIPTVKRLEAFLQDYCRYTDITVMTDEEGVEGRLQPTRDNMIREMEALSSRVRPGDRRVFHHQVGEIPIWPCGAYEGFASQTGAYNSL